MQSMGQTILLGPSYITATIKERSPMSRTYKTLLLLQLKGKEEAYLLRKFQTIVPKEERGLWMNADSFQSERRCLQIFVHAILCPTQFPFLRILKCSIVGSSRSLIIRAHTETNTQERTHTYAHAHSHLAEHHSDALPQKVSVQHTHTHRGTQTHGQTFSWLSAGTNMSRAIKFTYMLNTWVANAMC